MSNEGLFKFLEGWKLSIKTHIVSILVLRTWPVTCVQILFSWSSCIGGDGKLPSLSFRVEMVIALTTPDQNIVFFPL